MKALTKYGLSLVTLLTLIILFANFSLSAATLIPSSSFSIDSGYTAPITIAEHKATMTDYISQLRTLNDRAFQLVQLTLETPIKEPELLKKNIDSINSEINTEREIMRTYLSSIDYDGTMNRDMLLLFNALNHTSSQMFYLEQLLNTTSTVEKVIPLESFFRARLAAADTLNALEVFVSRE